MPIETPDVLVIGLGAMGCATVYQLAKRGVKVVGIDRFTPPHIYGSTHGETRITRQAIGEGAQFVPLALRSHEIWREVEAETGATLFNQCGGIVMAREGLASHMHGQADFLGNTFAAAAHYGIAHERLDAKEIAARFPQFHLQGDETAYFEPGAGYVVPEACVSAQLALAARHGATLRFGEQVISIDESSGLAVVETTRTRYEVGLTIICAGPWLPTVLPQLASRVVIRRQVLHWFPVAHSVSYATPGCPIYIWHWGDGPDDVFYGFPQAGAERVVKVATEQVQTSTTADSIERQVSPAESHEMYRTHIAGRLNGVMDGATRAATCLYTSTPDANFIIDRLPDRPETIVVSACSGHGFKHSAAIGEAVAEMVERQATPEILLPFALKSHIPPA
jgi:sarcosine oxidase